MEWWMFAIWLAGMLTIAALMTLFALSRVVHAEVASRAIVPWWDNKALLISGALWMHGSGTVLLFASSALRHFISEQWALFVFWTALAVWLVAKIVILYAIHGKVKLCFTLLGMWTVGCLAAALIWGPFS